MTRQFDPKILSQIDLERISTVEIHPADPTGLPWQLDTTTLEKLAVWAAWGLFIADPEEAVMDATRRKSQFDADSLGHAEWETVKAIETDPLAPSTYPWDEGLTTLQRLVWWAQVGRSLSGRS